MSASSTLSLSFFSTLSPSLRSRCFAADLEQPADVRPHLRIGQRTTHRHGYFDVRQVREFETGDVSCGGLEQPRNQRQIAGDRAIVDLPLAARGEVGIHQIKALHVEHVPRQTPGRREPVERGLWRGWTRRRSAALRDRERAFDFIPEVDARVAPVDDVEFERARQARHELITGTAAAQVRRQRAPSLEPIVVHELLQERRDIDAGQTQVETQALRRRVQVIAHAAHEIAAEDASLQWIDTHAVLHETHAGLQFLQVETRDPQVVGRQASARAQARPGAVAARRTVGRGFSLPAFGGR